MLTLILDTYLSLTMPIQHTLRNMELAESVAWLLPLAELLKELIPIPGFEGSHLIGLFAPVLLVMLAADQAIEFGGSSLDTLRRKIVQILTSRKQDTEVRAIQALKLQQSLTEPTSRKNWQKRIENGKHTRTLIEQGFQEAIGHSKIRVAIRLRMAALAMTGIQNGLSSIWRANQLLVWLEKRTDRVVDTLLRDMAMG